MNTYEKARTFILRNARPIDLAIFKHHFEKGSAEDVISALSAYQNPDGGFGWGIEADNFNPASTPMGVWKATVYISKIGGTERTHRPHTVRATSLVSADPPSAEALPPSAEALPPSAEALPPAELLPPSVEPLPLPPQAVRPAIMARDNTSAKIFFFIIASPFC